MFTPLIPVKTSHTIPSKQKLISPHPVHLTAQLQQMINSTRIWVTMMWLVVLKHSHLLFVILIFKWGLSPFVVIANGLIIVIVMKYVKKVTATHVVIAFLSLSGFFVGTIVHPLNVILYFTGNSLNFNHLCNFLTWIKYVAVGLNFCAILLIAFERCLLVTSFKLHHKFLTVRRQVYMCIGSCASLVVSATIYTFNLDSVLRFGDCYVILKISQLNSTSRLIVYTTIMTPFAVLTFCLTYCYVRICHFVWKHGRALHSNQNSSNQNNFQKEKKTTFIIAIILTMFFVGKGPAFIYTLMTMNKIIAWKIESFESVCLLWYITALTDSFIYAFKIPEFQEGYRKILCCFQKTRKIKVAPLPQPGRNHTPLEPRRELWSPRCTI